MFVDPFGLLILLGIWITHPIFFDNSVQKVDGGRLARIVRMYKQEKAKIHENKFLAKSSTIYLSISANVRFNSKSPGSQKTRLS